jgi:hypothetical protein
LRVEPRIDVAFSKAPLPADTHRGNLAGLDQAIHGAEVDLEVLEYLLGRKKNLVVRKINAHPVGSASLFYSLRPRGQFDCEHRAALGTIRGVQLAAMLLHDAVRNRETEPRAFAHFFRGEKWFEQPRQNVG